MSRVITFSRYFPVTHPRKCEPTHFVEKIWTDLFWQHIIDNRNMDEPLLEAEIKNFYTKTFEGKGHTIRDGNRWEVGDWFSPRVWSGKPYASKQIIITPLIEIKKIWSFEVILGAFYLNGKRIDVTSSDIPTNDGLSSDDFLGWFPDHKPFSGQILCWNENINY